MFFKPIGYAAILGSIFVLSACQPMEKPAEAEDTAAAMRSPHDPDPDMKLKIRGGNPSDALNSGAKITALLNDLEAPPRGNLKARINGLLNNPSDKLAGLGGIQSRAALEAALVTLDNSGDFQGPLSSFSVVGQIQDEVDGETGFYFKPGEPMHIWVEMITTATRTLPNGGEKSKSWAERFRVEVPANAMVVEYKSGSGGDVFPAFGGAAFPIPSGMATGFDWKLWAVGDAVQVTDYWIDRNVQPGTDPSYPPGQRYDQNNHPANLANVFASDEDACFDMMFAKNPALDVSQGGALDNGELPADSEPPYYCLGRCAAPPIVNTK